MATTTATLISSADELTATWLDGVLHAGGHLSTGAEVRDLDAVPLGTGQMCDSYRVTLHLAGTPAEEDPRHLIVKLPSSDPGSRAAGVNLRAYEKEVRFYQELASSLPVATPTCYHSAIEPGTASFVLALEDMAPARVGDQLAGCSAAEARGALRQLVGLHAPRWGDPTLADLEWLHGSPDVARMFFTMMLPGAWTGFLDRYGEAVPGHVRQAGQGLIDGLAGYLAPTGRAQTITHGDYRLDNLLFDEAGGVKAVLDWQTGAVGPALSDVAYFLGAGLLAEDRREHEERLVLEYHEGLLDAGVTGYGWDDCWTDHRRGTLSGLVMVLVASGLVERTERGDEMFLVMASRHAQHALDLDALSLL